MRKPLAVALTVFSFLYLIFAPFIFIPNLSLDIYTEGSKAAAERFTGILTLWNTCPQSRKFVNYYINYTEKNNVYLFIEAENITQNEARARLDAGEAPDIIIFSSGLFSSPSALLPLSPSELLIKNATNTAVFENDIFAYPFMASVSFPNADSEETTAEVSVIYAAAIKSDDDKQNAAVKKTLLYFLSERFQSALAAESAVPTCFYEGLYETADKYSAAYEALFSDLKLPKLFSSE